MEKQKIYFANQTNTKVYNKVQSQMENNKNPFCKLAVAKLISQQPTSLGHSCFCFFSILYPIYCIFYCSALKKTKYKENCSEYCSSKEILKSI